MPPSPVDSSLRGWNEKQATSPCGRPIRSHSPSPADLAADRARRVLDHRQAAAPRAIVEDRAPGRTASRAGARTRMRLGASRDAPPRHASGSMLKRVRLDVHEHRHGAAVADRVGGGDERVADRDHFVAGPTPSASSARCSAVVQLDTAQACGAPTHGRRTRARTPRPPAPASPSRTGWRDARPRPRARRARAGAHWQSSAHAARHPDALRPPPGHQAAQALRRTTTDAVKPSRRAPSRSRPAGAAPR